MGAQGGWPCFLSELEGAGEALGGGGTLPPNPGWGCRHPLKGWEVHGSFWPRSPLGRD